MDKIRTAHISIGSNLGDSRLILEAAVAELCALASDGRCRRSDFVESEPWGFVSDRNFLNIGIDILSDLEPLELLKRLQKTERKVAQQFATPDNPDNRHRNDDGTYRDRVVDIDLIFYGDIRMSTPELTLPHPRAALRKFVTAPLRQLGHDPKKVL